MYYIKLKNMFKYILDIYKEFQKLSDNKRFTELEFYLKNVSYYCLTFLGLNYLNQNELKKAKRFFEICDEIDPSNWETKVNLSNVYYKFKDLHKALVCVEKALQCHNGYQEDTIYNLAVINSELHKTQNSLENYKSLMQINPNHLLGKYNYSAELLKNNLYEEGWKLYESRFERFENLKLIKKEFSDMVFWNGEDLKNKSILLFNEQGTGDLFQFIRFAKNLKDMGAKKIILLANQSIKSLFNNSNLVDEIIIDKKTYLEKKEKIDFVCSVCSLPLILKIFNSLYFWQGEYFKNNQKLELEKDKLNVGLVYCGSHLHPYDWKRSIKLSEFLSLQDLNKTNFYILQKFTQRNRIWENKVVDPLDVNIPSNWKDLDDFVKDYSDTATVINSLDLIISVDTSVAHLAGAMGKKVLLLLDYNNDWRWGLDLDSTTWYPSIEIIRQEKPFEGWSNVVNKLKNKIIQLQDQIS